jgi:hypothetical protein
LSLRNKINNDNQQILSLQEDLGATEKEVLKLRVSLEEKEKLEKANSVIKIRQDIPPVNDRPLSAGQKNVHVATSNLKHSFMNILKTKKSKEAPKRPKFSFKKKRISYLRMRDFRAIVEKVCVLLLPISSTAT